jgi:hypothetical protein
MRAWILVVLIAVVVPRIARADDKKAAREEFAAGQEADKRKDYEVAIQHYLRAYDLSPHPNALYNAAVDYERIGDLRESATFYGRYLDESTDTEDRGKVTRLIENLRKRPSTVAIRTTPPGGQITIDGTPVGQAPVSRELPGGTHVITAAIGDRKSQRQVTLEYGEPQDVVLALTEQQGLLTVTSNVSGAQVTVDGAASGSTPVTIAVPAGDRKVTVHSEGYSTLERTVKVPAEGSAQITATLIRPLGYVPPTNPATVLRSWVFAAEGGRVLQADTNVLHLGFGYRIRGWEATIRLVYFGQNTSLGYGLLIRRYLGESKIKPYLGAFGEYGSAKSGTTSAVTIGVVGGHAGLMLELLTTDRYAIEVAVDGGAALFSAGGERELAFPVTASLQFRGR